MNKFDKALVVANARVAVLQGATRTWCDNGEFNCDIPGYRGYAGTLNDLNQLCEDLDVASTFLESDNVTKIHVTSGLPNGALLGLTVPLPDHKDMAGESIQVAVIAALHVYYLANNNKLKETGELMSELARVFDVSFGAEQTAAAE